MALPKLKSPIFEITLPISKKKLHYRQYTVKEEKILLLAQQSKEAKDMVLAIKQIVSNCVVEKIDPGAMPKFDLELLLVSIRIVSTSNEAILYFQDTEEDEPRRFLVNLQDVIDENLKNFKMPSLEIPLNDEWAISMKHINIDMFFEHNMDDLNDPVKVYDILGAAIEKVYHLTNEDEVYYFRDASHEEIAEFIDSFDKKTSERIAEYFKELPVLTKTLTWKNRKGTDRSVALTGIADFFDV